MQVDVEQPRPNGIELILLENCVVRGLLSVEDDVEDGVEAVLAREDAAELALLDRERMRLLAGSVKDAGDETVRAKAARNGTARLLARLHVKLDSLTGHTGGQV